MKLVVGLGNPGKEYQRTRHNVGFMVVDRLSTKSEIRNSKWFDFAHHPEPVEGQIQNPKFKFSKKFNADILQTDDLVLAKPVTFMNQSGGAVKKLAGHFLLDANQLDARRLYVIHDDLDIPLGKYKIQKGKGPKEHRGILSIEMALGSKDFWRVRIGVDNRHVARGTWHVGSGDEYVLSRFPAQELAVINQVINQVAGELCSKWEIG